MNETNPILRAGREEFENHIAHGKGDFRFSQAMQEMISRLARSLEVKRQAGALTKTELTVLKDIDGLWERIAKYNQDPRKNVAASGDNVYNLKASRMLEETHDTSFAASEPKISETQVEEIISVINKQFQEKVMDKLHNKEPHDSVAINSGEGRSLQDYMSLVHAERPSVPFADPDSDFDLSKLISRD